MTSESQLIRQRATRQRITIISDPLRDDHGPTRPVLLVAGALATEFDVVVASPVISEEIKDRIHAIGGTPLSLRGKNLTQDTSMGWIETWGKEALIGTYGRRFLSAASGGIVLNFSNTVNADADVWWLQGPPSVTLANIQGDLPVRYRIPYWLIAPLLRALDRRMTRRMRERSGRVIANSRYCGTLYFPFGVEVSEVINSPIDLSNYFPEPAITSERYFFTYCGKETDYAAIEEIARAGVQMRGFGSKLRSGIPSSLLACPNFKLLPWLSEAELRRQYSNAIATVFAYTDEPFGYVPVESMACGTPCLTYGHQGPGETVLDGKTGWIANSRSELVEQALALWEDGYPREMRLDAATHAKQWDYRTIAQAWKVVLKQIVEGRI